MADIFISYANEDRDSAARFAAHLESIGWRVWWDRRIPAGRTWRAVLAEALVDARCMIVLWSENSVESPWVAEEAEEARRLGKKLVPVLIQRVEPPMGFRTIQAADLTGWDGSADDPALRQLIADLQSLIGTPEIKVAGSSIALPPRFETKTTLRPWYWTHWSKAALGFLTIAGLAMLWHNWPSGRSPIPEPLPIEKPSDPAVQPRRLINLRVSADRKNLEPSETLKLTATGNYSDGSETEITGSIRWSSSDTWVAIVDEHGEVKALRAGTTKIIAKVGSVESSEWPLAVASVKPAIRSETAPTLVELRISASRQNLLENEKVALRARGKYSDDSEKSLSRGIDWQISDRMVASVSANGELVALQPGKVEVVARAGRLTSAPLAFNVKAARRIIEPVPETVKVVEPPPIKHQAATSQTTIAGYLERAESFREQGNYAAALAELEKARAIDGANEEIRRQIQQTKRACNAEKILGSKPDC
jgi:hypothetical protein